MKLNVPISCAMHIFYFIVNMCMLRHHPSTSDVNHPLSLLLCHTPFHPVGYPSLTHVSIHLNSAAHTLNVAQ